MYALTLVVVYRCDDVPGTSFNYSTIVSWNQPDVQEIANRLLDFEQRLITAHENVFVIDRHWSVYDEFGTIDGTGFRSVSSDGEVLNEIPTQRRGT